MSQVHDISSLGRHRNASARALNSWTAGRAAAFLSASLALALLAGGCAAPRQDHWLARDDWMGRDKLKHLAVGTALGAATTYAAHDAGASIGEARAVGVSMVVTVGAAKEVYDRDVKKTVFSWQDMAWNLLGGVLGSLLVRAD